jgi:PAS domain S-box-containing protein
MFFQRSIYFRYGFSCVLLIIAGLIRGALDNWAGDRVPFMAFFPAVGVVAYYCGAGPAIFSTIISLLAGTWFFLTPRYSFLCSDPSVLLSQIMFVVTAAGFVIFSRRMAIEQVKLRVENEKYALAESALLKTSRKHTLATEIASLGVCEWNFLTHEIAWDKKHFEIFGYEAFSFTPTLEHFNGRIHREDRDRVNKVLEEARINRGKVDTRFRLELPEGLRWVQAIGEYKYDADGNAISLHGAVRDITEEKQALEKLHESEARLRAAQKAAGAGVWDWDIKSGCLFWSPEYYDLYGISTEVTPTFEGWIASIHPIDRKRVMDETQRVLELGTNIRLDFRINHPLRGERWLQAIGETVCDEKEVPVRMHGIALDITERKSSERALAQVQEFNEKLLCSTEDCIKVINLQGRLIYISAGGLRTLEIDNAATVLEREYASFYQGADRDAALQALETAKGGGTGKFEGFCATLSGKPKWWQVVVTPVFDFEGKVEKLLAVSRDITESKEADSRICFQAGLLDAVREAVIATDLCGKVLAWNRGAERLYGWTESEALNKNILTLTPSEASREQAAEIMSALQQGESWSGEFPVKRADGSVFTAMVTNTPIRSESGELIGIVGVSRDITDQKRAERALHKSEKEFRAIFELSAVGKAQADPKTGRFVRVNHAFCQITGYSESELLGKTIADITHPEDQTTLQTFRNLVEGEIEFYKAEKRYVRKDGSIAWVLVTASVVRSSEGEVIASIASIQDINDRKQAEIALRDSEEKFSKAFFASPDAMALSYPDGRAIDVNESWEKLFGYTRQEAIGKTPDDLNVYVDSAVRPKFRQHIKDTGRLPASEVQLRVRSGDLCTVLMSVESVSLKGDVLYITILRDITERKKIEEALRQSRERLQLVIDNAAASIVYCNTQGYFQFVNRRYAERFNLTVDQVAGRKISDVLGSAYHVIEPYIKRAESGETVEFEVKVPYEQIGARFIHCTYVPDCDSAGKVLGYVGLITDVTQRRVQEETIRESETRLRTALDAGKLGTWEWDIVLNKVFWSDRIYEFHGLSHKEFDGTMDSFSKMIHPDDALLIGQKIQAALESKAPYEFEFRIVRPDGEVRWLYTSARVIFDETGKPLRMLGGTIDLTDRKRTEMALRAAQESLALHSGQLEKQVAERTASLHETTQQLETFCYTVAHDLRAPLRAQQAFSYALLEEYGLLLDETAKDYLNRIINSASHLNQLVNDLLAYARLSREDLRFERIDCDDLVRVVLTQNATQIKSRDATVTVEKGIPPVMGNELTLSLSMENLLSNAMKFVQAGVKPRIHIKGERRNDRVRIWIEDNGIGIAPEHQTQIFGVFHRLHTKAYPGTGIGLALVDKAIQRMGGSVGVVSEGGQGSRFWLELPAAEPIPR